MNLRKKKLFWGISFSVLIIFCFPKNSKTEEIKGILLQGSRGFYNTSIGKLKDSLLLQNGNKISQNASGGITIVFGFIHIQSNEATGILDDITIFKGKTNLTSKITFIQDLDNKKWVATDGVMCIDNGSIKLLDNTTVKVVGGKDNPIKIDGKEFHDTSVTIKNGKAM